MGTLVLAWESQGPEHDQVCLLRILSVFSALIIKGLILGGPRMNESLRLSNEQLGGRERLVP